MGSELVITKWLDSKCIYMCSEYVSPTETTEVKQWDQSTSKYINVQCPQIAREYNKTMGGVDLSDTLISLYRTQVKTKRWYIKNLFSLRQHSKSQRLAFVQASLHATRKTKEETNVPSEVYFESFSLPSSQKHDTNSKGKASVKTYVNRQQQPT